MATNSLFRNASVLGVIAAMSIGMAAGPAAAHERRAEEAAGAAIAIGIGALVLGKVLSSRDHDRDRGRHREYRPEPRIERYSHPAPHVHRAPPRQEYQNSGR